MNNQRRTSDNNATTTSNETTSTTTSKYHPTGSIPLQDGGGWEILSEEELGVIRGGDRIQVVTYYPTDGNGPYQVRYRVKSDNRLIEIDANGNDVKNEITLTPKQAQELVDGINAWSPYQGG